MTPVVFQLVLVSVALSALAQMSLKAGMAAVSAGQVAQAGSVSSLMSLLSALTQPFVLGGLGLYALGALVWMLVLARLDVSVAYPFVALGFVMVMVLGAICFGEPITAAKLAGTALVGLGVWLIACG
jgi:multidrug transporter EmrE-like cation transporter